MKNFIPFLLLSVLLFAGMKFVHQVEKEKLPSQEVLKDNPSDSVRTFPTLKEFIFSPAAKKKVARQSTVSSLHWLQPSDFKPICYYNCKLLSSSKNGLCFFPGGLSLRASSRPLYDETWKRQFIQFL